MAGPPSEAQRVRAAIGGDLDALTELLGDVGPLVRAQIAAQIDATWSGALDADDVMQVTYIEAFLRISGFEDRGPGAFRAWLSNLAMNNLRDAIRALSTRKRTPPGGRIAVGGTGSEQLLLEELAVTTTTASRHFAVAEVQAIVRECVEQLPEDYARVIRMYDFDGQSAVEVAAAIGRSTGSVYMLRARAIDLLRDRLFPIFNSPGSSDPGARET